MSGAPRLLLSREDVARRREAARGPLAPLAGSLAADLAVARGRELFVPPEKARMTRVGGRCRADGTMLAFDPYSPREHRCPACGATYADEADYRWWIFWYQLWLAERAVHGATLALLTDDVAAGDFARDVLDAYAERYLTYPNRDNVLGPTRPFFSTYLESIWLLQLCVALDLLEARGGERSLGARVRDRVIEPSRALIARYDERGSNRQVWNAAALAAAARMLGDDGGFERALSGPSGVLARLDAGLLADGTWYEGENYHQFAHRGLWYGVTLAERAGLSLPPDLVARFDEGFVAPFHTALPDLTLPARRDSQWAITLRQWRWAEWCELGLARRDDPRLAGALAALYDADAPVARRDTGRWRSAAESERNEPATRLDRADLGWRSLLHARPEPAVADRWAPSSVLLPSQGIAVFRRDDGARWAALDYGASGGGHGHPDRLNVLLAHGPRRWLDDMGTGSYVERKLHWYRSTLAHNAPLVDGRSQPRVDGALEAYEERGDWGWARASASIAPGVHVRRALVVGPRYVIEHLGWDADREVTLDLPHHVHATDDLAWHPVEAPGGAGGLEDGFDFVTDAHAADVPARHVVRIEADPSRAIHPGPDATPDGDPLRAWIACDAPSTWVRAVAPSSPGRGSRPFTFVRATAARGVIVAVWDVSRAVAAVELRNDAIAVRLVDGDVDWHHVGVGDLAIEWSVAERRGEAARFTLLRGARPAVEPSAAQPVVEPTFVDVPACGVAEWRLGEAHYRPSEETWDEAGQPSAVVRLALEAERLALTVDVATPHPCFVVAGAENALDNERPDINGDGIQLHLQVADVTLAWLLVPEEGTDGAVRVIPLAPAAEGVVPTARWARTPDGYRVEAMLPRDALTGAGPLGFDLIVNETAPGRERRRGQLVLSGARGEFVYLQGDRHDPARFLKLRLVE